jgi:hypothetical protein
VVRVIALHLLLLPNYIKVLSSHFSTGFRPTRISACFKAGGLQFVLFIRGNKSHHAPPCCCLTIFKSSHLTSAHGFDEQEKRRSSEAAKGGNKSYSSVVSGVVTYLFCCLTTFTSSHRISDQLSDKQENRRAAKRVAYDSQRSCETTKGGRKRSLSEVRGVVKYLIFSLTALTCNYLIRRIIVLH